jgi:hypothetical protein
VVSPPQPGGVSAPVGAGFVTLESADHEFTSIPVLSLRYKNFFVSGSYYAETTFSFPRTAGSVIDVAIDQSGNIIDRAATLVDLSAKRSEWDVALGYYLNPYLGVTVGYKNMNQDVTTTSSLVDTSGQVLVRGSPSTTKFEISGPTLGLFGSVPVVNRFGVYGSFGYGFLETKTAGAPHQDSPYYVVEGGCLIQLCSGRRFRGCASADRVCRVQNSNLVHRERHPRRP